MTKKSFSVLFLILAASYFVTSLNLLAGVATKAVESSFTLVLIRTVCVCIILSILSFKLPISLSQSTQIHLAKRAGLSQQSGKRNTQIKLVTPPPPPPSLSLSLSLSLFTQIILMDTTWLDVTGPTQLLHLKTSLSAVMLSQSEQDLLEFEAEELQLHCTGWSLGASNSKNWVPANARNSDNSIFARKDLLFSTT